MRHIPKVFENTRLWALRPGWSVLQIPLFSGEIEWRPHVECPGFLCPQHVFETARLEYVTWCAEIAGEWWEWEATGDLQRQWHERVEYMLVGQPRRIRMPTIERPVTEKT